MVNLDLPTPPILYMKLGLLLGAALLPVFWILAAWFTFSRCCFELSVEVANPSVVRGLLLWMLERFPEMTIMISGHGGGKAAFTIFGVGTVVDMCSGRGLPCVVSLHHTVCLL